MLHFHLVTLFPESIRPYLESSILKRAQEALKPHGSKPGRKPVIKISYYDPKTYATEKDGRIDRRPYGGGPGMVMEPEAVLKAASAAWKKSAVRSPQSAARHNAKRPKVIFFATDGVAFDEALAKKLAKEKDIILIAGRYEGIDARVPKILKALKVSVGPYVLTGGELPAATVIDAVARFVPGVLGTYESLERERVSSPDVYTRPEVLHWEEKKYRVPKILLSGHRAKIEEWKKTRG